LKNEPNLPIFRWIIQDAAAIDCYPAPIWAIKSGDKAQGGGLPTTRWSKQSKEFSLAKGKTYPVQRIYFPK